MKGQQKEKESSSPQIHKVQAILSNELHRLIELWLSNSVDDNYQSRVMEYLDQFQSKEVQLREIKKQIELTLKKQSPYFMIHHLLQQKEQLLSSLQKEMESLEQYRTANNQDEPDLQSVCNILNDLRQSQMLIVESIMQLLKKYKIKRQNAINSRSKTDYSDIVSSFSLEVAFIKESVLKYYIPFNQQLDPLFVQQAKVLKKRYKENSIVYNKSIEKLLTLPPSYMYRLLRAKKNMEDLISSGSSEDIEQLNAKQYKGMEQNEAESLGEASEEQNKPLEKKLTNHQGQKTEKQSEKIVLCFTLDNSAYLSQQKKLKSRANTRSQTINAYQQKYNKLYYSQQPQQFQKSRNMQAQSDRIREEPKNKRFQIGTHQADSFKSKQRAIQRLKISPPILKIDIKSQLKNNLNTKRFPQPTQSQKNRGVRDVRIYKEQGTQHSPIEVYSKNKRFYLLQLEKDSKIPEESSYPALKRKKQLNKIPHQTPIRQRIQRKNDVQLNAGLKKQLQIRAASKKNKNVVSGDLFISSNQQQLSQLQYKATHKNFIRQIPKGLKNKNQLSLQHRDNDVDDEPKRWEKDRQQSEEQEFLQQKQRQIIAKINRKYKLLAMKEKQYQLSKLGHVIYHRMRQKQLQGRFKTSPKKKQYQT